jgi:hypothetical protein
MSVASADEASAVFISLVPEALCSEAFYMGVNSKHHKTCNAQDIQ